MIVRNGGSCRLLVAALLAATLAIRLWDPGFLQFLRSAVLQGLSMLSGGTVGPAWAIAAEIAAVIAAAALIAWLAPRLRPPQVAIPGGLAALAVLAGAGLAALRFGLAIDPVWPIFSIAVISAGTGLFLHFSDERQRERVRAAFGHSLPPAITDTLAASPHLVSFAAARRELTAMSIRIRDLGKVLGPLPPAEAAAFLRRVHDAIAAIVLAHGGMLHRQDGNGTVALFNVPLEDPLHAGHAAQAAARLCLALEPLNAERRAAAEAAGQKFRRVYLDIGVDTGSCTVGNLISDRYPAWTALGPPIAAAAAISELCKEYGVGAIVSGRAVAAMTDPPVLEVGLARIGSEADPLRVFTLRGPMVPDEATGERLAAAHARMIAAYRIREWADAEAALRDCRAFRIEGLGTLYSLYRTRILTAREIAPPAGWEGTEFDTLGESAAVTEFTPRPPPPRHSDGERE